MIVKLEDILRQLPEHNNTGPETCRLDNIPNIAVIDYEDHDLGYVSVYYDYTDNRVIRIVVEDIRIEKYVFEWRDPDLFDILEKEYSESDIVYALTDSYEDIMDKAICILNNRKYSTDVVMNLELDEETHNLVQKQAIKFNMTLDEYLTKLVLDATKI